MVGGAAADSGPGTYTNTGTCTNTGTGTARAALAPASTGMSEMEDLKPLGELHAQRVLTAEEFAAKKAQILVI